MCRRMSVKNPLSVDCFLPATDNNLCTRLWCVCEGTAAAGPWAAETIIRPEKPAVSHSLSTGAGGGALLEGPRVQPAASRDNLSLLLVMGWQGSQQPVSGQERLFLETERGMGEVGEEDIGIKPRALYIENALPLG